MLGLLRGLAVAAYADGYRLRCRAYPGYSWIMTSGQNFGITSREVANRSGFPEYPASRRYFKALDTCPLRMS